VIADYLYVGTDRGALRRQMNTFGDFEFVNTPEGMLSDDILDVAAAGDSLFFATKNDIIVIDIRSGQTTTISDPGKFGVWHIRKILADNANIWAATDMGLWKYRLADGRGRLFTRGDGMISDDVRAIEIVGDYLWLATPRGVIRFFWNRSDRID
jgi:ligand-binding sensor domain-containing protein